MPTAQAGALKPMAEDPFRVAVLVIFVAAVAVALPHRLRARTSERVSRRDEGWPILITLRLAGLVLWVGAIGYIINPLWLPWAAMPLPPAVRWTGVVIGAAGVVTMHWTMSTLGKNLTDTVFVRANASLVTSGPYRFVRHPFYVAAGLLMLGVALATANALVATASVLVVALLAIRTPKEEQKLEERFGEPYRAYRARTGAFFPRWIK
jgi:protein-S-isoprenylcysteine O-methyltransferase Ste14